MIKHGAIKKRPVRYAFYVAVAGLLTGGGLIASTVAASANTAGFCDASGASATCTETQTIPGPATISASVSLTSGSTQDATIKYSVTCSLNGASATTSGTYTADTPVTEAFTLPYTDPTTCTATATGTLSGTGDMLLSLTYTPASSPTPTPTPSPTGHLVKGYDGKCLDDLGNSSANGAKVAIWNCNSSDAAQLWTYSNGELIHNGKCLNDASWGGIRTKQILWSCDGALNELWTHLSNNEFVLNAKDYKLCLDDPGASKTNGTQVIAYTCKNSSNQHWSKP